MNIKITTDSTCDLPKALLDAHNITLTPLTVIKNDEAFKDGVTITPDVIFAHVAAGGALCSTSAVSVGEYIDHFESFQGTCDGILHVSLGSGFSASYQNACLAAQEFDNVCVVDSMNLSCGQGHIVMKACQLAKTAQSLEALKEALEAYVPKVESSFLVDKLDYLAKGGRCSSVAALGANLLNLKPCIEVREGKMSVVKKYRGNYAKCLATYAKERLADREDLDTGVLFIAQTKIADECRNAVLDVVNAYGKFEAVHESVAGCTISCHCGPGTLGLLLIRK